MKNRTPNQNPGGSGVGGPGAGGGGGFQFNLSDVLGGGAPITSAQLSEVLKEMSEQVKDIDQVRDVLAKAVQAAVHNLPDTVEMTATIKGSGEVQVRFNTNDPLAMVFACSVAVLRLNRTIDVHWSKQGWSGGKRGLAMHMAADAGKQFETKCWQAPG